MKPSAEYIASEYARAKAQHPELNHHRLADMVCNRIWMRDTETILEEVDVDEALRAHTAACAVTAILPQPESTQ